MKSVFQRREWSSYLENRKLASLIKKKNENKFISQLGSNQSTSLLGSKYATYSLKPLSRWRVKGRKNNAEGGMCGNHLAIAAVRLDLLYL